MDLYKILLVDDEVDVLRAMKKKIDWEAMGFCPGRDCGKRPGSAGNGRAAAH